MAKSIHSRPYRVFKALLRETRESKGLTQIDVARRLKIAQSAVSKCELGERRLDIIELRRWCGALDVSLPKFVEQLEAQLRLGK